MTFSGNFMPPRFTAGTASNSKPKMETCAVCGHDSSRQNVLVDVFSWTGPVCGHCRNPLGTQPLDGDPED